MMLQMIFGNSPEKISLVIFIPTLKPNALGLIGSAVRGCAKLVTCLLRHLRPITGTTRPRWRLLSHWYYTSSSSHGGAPSSALALLDH